MCIKQDDSTVAALFQRCQNPDLDSDFDVQNQVIPEELLAIEWNSQEYVLDMKTIPLLDLGSNFQISDCIKLEDYSLFIAQ